MKRHPRPFSVSMPVVISRAQREASEVRDELAQANAPKRESTSTSPRRCKFCREWRTPTANGERCSHCRQLFEPKPLVGLKAVG